MAIIANLDIILGARTSKLDAGFMAAQKRTSEFSSSVASSGVALDSAFGELGGMIKGALASIPGASAAMSILSAASKAVEATRPSKAKEMAETAAATQLAAVAMRGFGQAADQAGRKKLDVKFDKRGFADFGKFAGKGLAPPVPPAAGVGAAASEMAAMGSGAAVALPLAAAFVVDLVVRQCLDSLQFGIDEVRKQMDAIDSVADSAKKLGVSFEELTALRYGLAQSSGLDQDSIDNALSRMTVGLAEAKAGGGALKATLDTMGLDAAKLLEMGPLEALKKISEKTQEIKGSGQQLAFAYDLFGKQGAPLVSALKEGPEAIDQMRIKVNELGLVLTDQQASMVGNANDAWEDVGAAASGVFMKLAVEFSPVATVIANHIVGIGKRFSEWSGFVRPVVDGFTYLAGVTWDWLEVLTASGRMLKAIAEGDFQGAGKIFTDAATFDSPDRFLKAVQAARDAANVAKPKVTEADLAGIEMARQLKAQHELTTATKSHAEATTTAADRARDAARDRIQSLRDEIDALRLGEQAAKAMHLARDGVDPKQIAQLQSLEAQKKAINEHNDLLKKGEQLRSQMASPMDKLKSEVLNLKKLLDAGAIDKKTFDQAAMDAAKSLIKPPESPKAPMAIAALQKGTVEQYSASRRIDADRQQIKNEETFQREQLRRLDAILRALTGGQRIGIVGA